LYKDNAFFYCGRLAENFSGFGSVFLAMITSPT